MLIYVKIIKIIINLKKNFFIGTDRQTHVQLKTIVLEPNNIFRITSTRSIKCRDSQNFLKFKKLEVVKFFFNFQRISY